MNIFASLIIFGLFIILFVLLLGYTLLVKLKVKDGLDLLECTVTAGCLGIVVLTLVAFAFRMIGLSYWWLLIMPAVTLWVLKDEVKRKISDFNKRKRIFNIGKIRYPLTVIIICSLFQVIVLIRGGMSVPGGYAYPSVDDTMWNIALAGELYHHFPPQHPGVAGERLFNNHYFYPLFLAVIRTFTGINPLVLYYQLAPILVSLLFGLALYTVSGVFALKKPWRVLSVFLGYFSGNASYFLPFFFGFKFDWRGNSFFSDQPFDQIVNPYSVLGFTLFLTGIFCFHKWRQKKAFGWAIVASFIFGGLYGFKAFGGIIVLLSLFVTGVWMLIRNRNFSGVKILLLTLFIFLPLFIFTTQPNVATLRVAPGWLLTELMAEDKVNIPTLVQVENYYKMIGNTLGLIKIKFIQLVIYIAGNLGIRIVGLIYVFYLWIRILFFRVRDSSEIIFILTSICVSLVIPLLTNLSTTPYNIIQFTPYALLILAVASCAALEKVYQWIVTKGKKGFGSILVMTVILLAVPVNIKNAISKLEIPEDIISSEEMEALRRLKRESGPEDVVLVDPKQFEFDAIYVSALSERRVYLASPGIARQTGNDPTRRVEYIERIFASNDELSSSEVFPADFIYIRKPFNKENLVSNLHQDRLERLFENGSVVIYKRL